MTTTALLSEISATVLSPRAVAILRISCEEVFGPMMYVASAPDLTAALALVDAQMPSDRGLVQAIVAAPSRRAEGERAPPPRPGLW
jgi:acyl-CoA reductase-like NAD-dependent aldehyde dehydrogenase